MITDTVETVETIRRLVMMTQIVLREDSTAIVLALEIDLEYMILETEAEAAFAKTHVTDSTAHVRHTDPDLETDARKEQLISKYQPIITGYVIYRL